ncbi:hypothetical protein Tco_1511314 [Tanacetum coccineum]
MMNINQDYQTSLRTPPYFDSNGGGDGGLKGGLVSWFVKPRTPKTPILMVRNEVEFVCESCAKNGRNESSGGKITEFSSRGHLNQLKRSSYDRVMIKTVNKAD